MLIYKNYKLIFCLCQEESAWQKAQGVGHKAKGARGRAKSNIAEGDELDTDRQAVKFFYIAKGSAAEVLTQIIIAHEIDYVSERDFDHVQKECMAISGMLTRLIQARSR